MTELYDQDKDSLDSQAAHPVKSAIVRSLVWVNYHTALPCWKAFSLLPGTWIWGPKWRLLQLSGFLDGLWGLGIWDCILDEFELERDLASVDWDAEMEDLT